jgi:hypothetical protein
MATAIIAILVFLVLAGWVGACLYAASNNADIECNWGRERVFRVWGGTTLNHAPTAYPTSGPDAEQRHYADPDATIYKRAMDAEQNRYKSDIINAFTCGVFWGVCLLFAFGCGVAFMLLVQHAIAAGFGVVAPWLFLALVGVGFGTVGAYETSVFRLFDVVGHRSQLAVEMECLEGGTYGQTEFTSEVVERRWRVIDQMDKPQWTDVS